jgi:uncharacterized protein (DUF4415 family)
MLLAPVPRLEAQAQTNVPQEKPAQPSQPKPPPAQIDSEIDADVLASSDRASDLWPQKQADALLDVISCYLDKPSVDKEVAMELKGKDGANPRHQIEIRIKLLKTLAKHNATSHCK